MSIDHPNDYDYRTAHLTGLGNIQGDPEALRDIGIPVDADDYASHLASAERVRQLMPTAIQVGRLVGDHERWVDSFHLTHPSVGGPVVYATAEQRAANTSNIDAVRAHIRPLGDRPTN